MVRIRDGVDILDSLSRCGFTTYELRRQHIFGERTIQKLRRGGLPSWRELDFICDVLNCQPGEIIEYKREKHNPQEPGRG